MNTKNDPSAAEARYRLIPSLRVAKLGSKHFLYDASAVGPVIQIPTQNVSELIHRVVARMLSSNSTNSARTHSQWLQLFEDSQDRAAIDLLIRQGYLEPAGAVDLWPPEPPEERNPGDGAALAADPRDAKALFDQKDTRNFFRRRTFFSLPPDIDDTDVQVGLVGVPFASNSMSAGAALGPDVFRLRTQQTGAWFDIHRTGFYSELGIEGGTPEILCQGVVIKDYGDLKPGIRTVDDLMSQTRTFVERQMIERGIPCVFVGGDHALTFPIVDTLVRHHSDLCLIHIDAHNDLFFADGVQFNHAAVVSNLLIYSNLQKVASFGLRTWFDNRVGGVSRLANDDALQERVHLYSLSSLKRMVLEPERFRRVLREIGQGRPCYLSVDLDVLSPDAIGHQVSTPAGTGLEWWELLEAVRMVMSELKVVGADIVEYNPVAARQGADDPRHPSHLLLTLIDSLARGPGETP